MADLITRPNLANVDEIYQQLIELHQGRTEADSLRVNARLILTLVNHIGDAQVIREAIDVARSSGSQDGGSTSWEK